MLHSRDGLRGQPPRLSRRGLGLAATLLSVLATSGSAGQAHAQVLPDRPVWAHRGGTGLGHVENTRSNFRAAADGGSLRWETDVRFSRTDYPVLLHDADLRRFGCPSLRIAELSVTGAGACRAADGQTITTLYQFTQDMRTYGARAWIELKTAPTAAQWRRLESRIRPLRGSVVVQSFLRSALTAASTRGYTTALLTSRPVAPGALPPGTDWYAPAATAVTQTQALAMHAVGVRVAAWTPGRAQWAAVPAAVDELISDDLPWPTAGPVRTSVTRPSGP